MPRDCCSVQRWLVRSGGGPVNVTSDPRCTTLIATIVRNCRIFDVWPNSQSAGGPASVAAHDDGPRHAATTYSVCGTVGSGPPQPLSRTPADNLLTIGDAGWPAGLPDQP